MREQPDEIVGLERWIIEINTTHIAASLGLEGRLNERGLSGAGLADQERQRQQEPVLVISPSSRGWPSMIETAATAGIVRPIAARADPSARFRLVCNRVGLGRPEGRQDFGKQDDGRDDDPYHGD